MRRRGGLSDHRVDRADEDDLDDDEYYDDESEYEYVDDYEGDQDNDDDYDDEYDDEYDDDYEELRPETSTARKILAVATVFLAVVVLAAGAGVVWVTRQLNPPGQPGAEIEVTISTGSSTAVIASLLEEEGVVASATVFRQYIRWKDAGPFQAGDFVFQENSAAWDAVEVLEAGPAAPPSLDFTIPEGLTVPETTQEIVDGVPSLSIDRLNELVASNQIRSRHQPAEVVNLEGFLYPNTYRVEEGQDETATLTQLINQFDLVADEVGLAQSAERVGLSPYEVLIVASLIQEEALIEADAPKIARVIYNRLADGIPLGVDATLCFYKGERPCSLTQSDLDEEHPYNSRLFTGLPPTPIASPGRAALEAALNPAQGPWIFYVLDPNAEVQGGHFFTDDADEFARVKAECEAADLGCG